MKVYFRRIRGILGGEDWGTNAIKQKKILINTLYYFKKISVPSTPPLI